MAQLTVSQCKDYLRIEHTAEDTPLAAWLAGAIAAVEAHIGRPVEAMLRSWTIERPTTTTSLPHLKVPMYPVAPVDSAGGITALVLTDGDDVELVEDTDYRIDLRTGVIIPLTAGEYGGGFSTFPYTIEAYVGLSALDEYDDRIEPVINAAILDVVADKYQRRNPAATNEAADGPSTAFTTFNPGLPQRVVDLLADYSVSHVGN